jgi:hypothetical protein
MFKIVKGKKKHGHAPLNIVMLIKINPVVPCD